MWRQWFLNLLHWKYWHVHIIVSPYFASNEVDAQVKLCARLDWAPTCYFQKFYFLWKQKSKIHFWCAQKLMCGQQQVLQLRIFTQKLTQKNYWATNPAIVWGAWHFRLELWQNWSLPGTSSHLAWSKVNLTRIVAFPTWTLTELNCSWSLMAHSLAQSEFNSDRGISDLNSDTHGWEMLVELFAEPGRTFMFKTQLVEALNDCKIHKCTGTP